MTELKVGWKVRLNTKKYAPVGKIKKIDGDAAEVEYFYRYARTAEVKTHLVKDLIHVCNKVVHRGYDWNECGRPVKEGNLCGLHLGHKKRRERETAKRQEELEASRRRADEAAQKRQDMQATLEERGLLSRIELLDPVRETVTLKLDTLLDIIRNS